MVFSRSEYIMQPQATSAVFPTTQKYGSFFEASDSMGEREVKISMRCYTYITAPSTVMGTSQASRTRLITPAKGQLIGNASCFVNIPGDSNR